MKRQTAAWLAAALLGFAVIPAWAQSGTQAPTEPVGEQPPPANPDPWEPFNRRVFAFNEFVDRYFLKPVAKGYQWVAPEPVEDGVSNVFANLGDINIALNNLLQAKFKHAAVDSGRFLLNSTVGLVGIFDVASRVGLAKHEEDFGQTLGYWGLDSGPYVVLPFLGPRTVRDGFGSIADGYADPVMYTESVSARNSLYGLRLISGRARLLEAERVVSGDRYTFLRDAYLQRREFLVKDGEVEDDDFGADFDEW